MDPALKEALEKILSKHISELTDVDKRFLRARESYLTDEQKRLFAAVLKKNEPHEPVKPSKRTTTPKEATPAVAPVAPVETPKPAVAKVEPVAPAPVVEPPPVAPASQPSNPTIQVAPEVVEPAPQVSAQPVAQVQSEAETADQPVTFDDGLSADPDYKG